MNCWEILGIEPTGDRRKIQDAYEQQLKFASEDEAKSLEAAFREAVGDDPGPVKQASDTVQTEPHREVQDEEPDRPLDANEGQVVREVVIQIKALLNDSSRSKDPGIWKAILDEPPADQPRLRREIGRQLSPRYGRWRKTVPFRRRWPSFSVSGSTGSLWSRRLRRPTIGITRNPIWLKSRANSHRKWSISGRR